MSRRNRNPFKLRTILQKFFEDVDTESNENGCWVWTGAKRKGGYGAFQYRGVKVSAHKWIVEYLLGFPIPPNCEICHSCDNPPCVYIHHLRPCTHSENIQETWDRTRR